MTQYNSSSSGSSPHDAGPWPGAISRQVRVSASAILAGAALAACASTPLTPSASASLTRAPCADVSFPIYFAKGSDQLSDPARQAIQAGHAQVRACQVREVDVFGLTSMDGPADQSLQLSQRRAAVVAQALADSGLPRPLFDVQGLGASGARTAKGAPAMLQRKTMVVIRVGAPA